MDGTDPTPTDGQAALAAVAELSIKLMRQVEDLQRQIDALRGERAA